MFPFDRSRIPSDKLDDPRLAKWENAARKTMQDYAFRMAVCIHEAARAIYMERAGAVCVILCPLISHYDAQSDEFYMSLACVQGDFGQRLTMDISSVARWYVAGGVAKRLLVGAAVEPDGGGDQRNAKDFSAWITQLGIVASSEDISACLEEARRDVEKDLRSAAFKRQLWDRANEMSQQLVEMTAEPKAPRSKSNSASA